VPDAKTVHWALHAWLTHSEYQGARAPAHRSPTHLHEEEAAVALAVQLEVVDVPARRAGVSPAPMAPPEGPVLLTRAVAAERLWDAEAHTSGSALRRRGRAFVVIDSQCPEMSQRSGRAPGARGQAAHRGTDGCARPLSVAASRSNSSSAFQPAMRRSDSAFTATARPSSSSACPRARRPRGWSSRHQARAHRPGQYGVSSW